MLFGRSDGRTCGTRCCASSGLASLRGGGSGGSFGGLLLVGRLRVLLGRARSIRQRILRFQWTLAGVRRRVLFGGADVVLILLCRCRVRLIRGGGGGGGVVLL